MKLGILGTGMIVQEVLTFIDQIDIDKIYLLTTARSIEKTKHLVEQYHLDGYFEDYDELLESDIDTVYVALPNHLHFEFAKKALLKDKHVIIEKPITATLKELEDLKTIAKQRHLIIFEAMNLHYLPALASIKENLGQLGDIKIVSLNYSQYSSRYGAFKAGEILPVFDYHKAGGALYDLNVYNLHFVIDLFGKPDDVHYYPNIEKGIDTSGILILDYGHFKAVCIGAKDCQAPMTNTIQGDKGNIIIENPVSQTYDYILNRNDGDNDLAFFDTSRHRLYYEFIKFKQVIDNNETEFADQMMELSTIAIEVMEQARKAAGIIFSND